jgi:hypothetical protein
VLMDRLVSGDVLIAADSTISAAIPSMSTGWSLSQCFDFGIRLRLNKWNRIDR